MKPVGVSFPALTGTSLSGQTVAFPDIVLGRVALLAVAFVQKAQGMLDSWIRLFEQVFSGDDSRVVYEIPMIEGLHWRLLSRFIDSGMRAGIPHEKHDHVITYYGATDSIRAHLGIESTQLGYVYLVNQQGIIEWAGKGYATDDEIAALLAVARSP